MRVHTVRQNRDSRYLRFIVNGEGDIAGSQHVWICSTTKVAEIAHGSILVPHDCMRADGEWWHDGVGAGPCASDRLPLVVHPERHPDAITCRERQLTDVICLEVPDHGFELQRLRASAIDRRCSRTGWIGDTGLCNSRNLPASVRRAHCTVVPAECRQLF